MVLRAEPIIETIESMPELAKPVIALTPSGRVFNHDMAKELSTRAGFTLLCGRYEGFDQRALDLVVDDELSLGDFVLAGGELAALCVIESVVRFARGRSAMTSRAPTSPLVTDSWSTPSTPNRPTCGVSAYRRFFSRATTQIERWRRAQALGRTRRVEPT